MHVIGHDCSSGDRPTAVGGCLVELTQQQFRMVDFEEDSAADHVRGSAPFEVWPSGVIGRSHFVMTWLISVAVERWTDESTCVAGQPCAVGGPGEEPDTVKGFEWR